MFCVGDGCLMEGISQEALSLAGHLKLNKLIVIWDHNGISIDGKVSLADSTDQLARFAGFGWHALASTATTRTDRTRAIEAAQQSDRPTLIACKDDHRLRLAQQGRDQQGPRLAARQGRGRSDPQGVGLGLSALRSSLQTFSTHGGRPARAAASAAGLGDPPFRAADLRGEFQRRISGDLPK